MADSDAKQPNDESSGDDECDAPTSVGKVSERLLKALKRGDPDLRARVEELQSPADAAEDADEGATSVLLRDAPSSGGLAISAPHGGLHRAATSRDEDESETLCAPAALFAPRPQGAPLASKSASTAPAQVGAPLPSSEPVVSPLVSAGVRWSYLWWLVPIVVWLGVAAAITAYVLITG